MAYRPYTNLFTRLVANTHEPERDGGCWLWKLRVDRWGYGLMEVYIPGLGRKKTLMAHIVAWVWVEAECQNADDLWLAYCELQASGLELDHTCEIEHCVRPDCLEPATPVQNCARRDLAKKLSRC